MAIEIRQLTPDDDRGEFQSGDPDLDRFFQKYAGQNQFKHHLGVTYVAVEELRIVGYFTIAPGTLEIDGLPKARRKRLPSYPLPILRLARLAVDRRERNRGIGHMLVRSVLELALELSTRYGCIGVLVDAKDGAVIFYERLGFERAELTLGEAGARPVPTPMFLAIHDVLAALGK